MQEQGAHWRKVWPEGAIDNADGDAEVIDAFLYPVDKTKKKVKETYPFTLDEDVLDTEASIKTAEGITN